MSYIIYYITLCLGLSSFISASPNINNSPEKAVDVEDTR